ncbi:hypothetical protein H8E06_00115 [bacterium]|nr:hypothetical protein [bacterium]
MAYPSDRETTYVNPNVCRSFNVTATTTLAALTGQVCSEVLIYNKTGQDLKIFDGGYSDGSNAFLIADGDSVTIRGITNANAVSAQTASGSGTIYYRTQYYSNNPSR